MTTQLQPPPQYQQSTPANSYVRYPNRPINFIGLHHTADPQGGTLPQPSNTGSWHRLFPADGSIRNAVRHDAAAFTILKTDLWRPSYIVRCPDGRVSDANYCGLQYEIEYAPQDPYNETPNAAQYAAILYALTVDTAQYGPIPGLPHGLVQSDKWRTEPHGLDYARLHLTWVDGFGYIFNPQEDPNDVTNPATDEQIKGWLETYGTAVNMQTGIMQFVAQSFRNGAPPTGEYRGPALPGPNGEPGEYAAPDGSGKIRHRFAQGIVEYDPNTGGLGWVEVVLHPE